MCGPISMYQLQQANGGHRVLTFSLKYDADKSTTHPNFDLTGLQTHDL